MTEINVVPAVNELQVKSIKQNLLTVQSTQKILVKPNRTIQVVLAGPPGPPGLQGNPGLNGVEIIVDTDPPPPPAIPYSQVWLDIS